METREDPKEEPGIIRTPDYRLRVFISSTLKELAEEREAARQAILNLHLLPVMFEAGARPHPAHKLYRAYLEQSHIFIGIYWKSYGWIAPGEKISGLEDEFHLSSKFPRLIYIKEAGAERQPALKDMLARIQDENTTSYKYFSTAAELKELVENDLALLLTERFESAGIERTTKETLSPPTNVPTPRNPLIGREDEMARAHEMLFRRDVGIVTLTGPGGTGKSRLGLQIALNVQGHFRDGVYLVRLTPVRDSSLVISTIADTLGIRETNDARLLPAKLQEYLREKQMLLLLDNFEQVLDAAPEVANLMEACPELRVIVTSRAPLRVRGEKELFVPPLAVPTQAENFDLQNVIHCSSVELFVQRAKSISPDFDMTNENASAIMEICQRLDGLPLAIELAAARVKMLTPHELLARLEHRFDLLRGGVRDLPERQQTLRSAIGWSYDLLSDSARKLFRRLSVFVGGWTLETAEAICDLDGDLGLDVMDEMETLVDNNLLKRERDAMGQSRFSMLETIREYAHERLVESREIDSIRQRHALYFLEFTRQTEPLTRSRQRVEATRRLRQEFDNIRAILELGCSTGENVEIAQQIGIALAWFWQSSMSSSEGSQWARRLMEHVGASTPLTIHAGLLWGIGGFAWSQGDLPLAITKLDESLRLARQTNDTYLLANILIVRGLVATSSGQPQQANDAYNESIQLLRTLGEKWGEALALTWLGSTALWEQDFDRARELHGQAIKLAREQGDPWILFIPLVAGGNSAMIAKNPQKAEPIYVEAISLLREIDDKWSLAWALVGWGHCTLQLGNTDRARDIFEECISVARVIGNPGALLSALLGVAILMTMPFQSRQSTERSSEKVIDAIHLLGAIATLYQNVHIFYWLGWWRKVHEQAVVEVRKVTDEQTWEKAFAEGQTYSLQQAVAIAMRELKDQ